MKVKYFNLITVLLIISSYGCNSCATKNLDQTISLQQGVNKIEDSTFYRYYIEGKRDDILSGLYSLDSDLKIGLYSVSLLETGQTEKALRSLPHYDKINFETDDIGTLVFPYQFPMEIKFYEGYAIYRIALIISDLNTDRVRRNKLFYTLLESNSFEYDKKKELLKKVEFEYNQFVDYPNQRSEILQILDSLSKKYPNFDQLISVRAICLMKNKDYTDALQLTRKLIRRNYLSENHLDMILNYFLETRLDIDSATNYVNIYENKFPSTCNYRIALFYYLKFNYAKLKNECNLCYQQRKFQDSIYCNILLGESYLNNRDFKSLNNLVVEFYKKNKRYIDNSLKDKEYNYYYKFELCCALSELNFDKYKRLIAKGNKFILPNLDNAKSRYDLSKQLYQLVFSKDTSQFDVFYNTNLK